MKLAEVNEYEREALRQMMLSWPSAMSRGTTTVHLRTLKLMERSALVEIEWFWDNDSFPRRKTRASDHTWSAKLTGKGVRVALMLGYTVHPEEHCSVPMLCEIHTPFEKNRVAVPTLKDWTKE